MSEEQATDAQIKRLYAVLHSLEIDPKEWKKKQGFGNYAKLSPSQCSEYIDDLEELEHQKKRGIPQNGRQPQASQLPVRPDNTANPKTFGTQQQEEAAHDLANEMLHLEDIMRFAMQSANSIVDAVLINCGADSTAATLKEKIGVSIFMEATSRRL